MNTLGGRIFYFSGVGRNAFLGFRLNSTTSRPALFGFWLIVFSTTGKLALRGFGGISYNGRSSLYASLNRLTSLREDTLTIVDLGSNTARYSPDSDRTLVLHRPFQHGQRGLQWHSLMTNHGICEWSQHMLG